ncbi:MAG TPA: Gfo/Idh/MocA family oxidoreductase, partial [Roseiflexaceae bacterium]|nr:Gfo/Idh/MocA family oxidoreductase [Roseiflexaceae bacterium]
AAQHLAAYRHAGYNVVALCDRNEHKARDRQARYFPEAATYTDYHDLLRRDDIEVVDLTPHPHDRTPIIEAAIAAGKHVLSQKPFVTDLDAGERLCALAERRGVALAVNQNGRWAPHFSYLRQALRAGLLGELASAHLSVHWDHSWIIGTPFEEIHDLVLYDFGIHWFDIVTAFFGGRESRRVYAATAHAAGQRARPPLLAQVLAEYDGAQASLAFNAAVVHGQQDRTYLAGSRGTAISVGPSLSNQEVTVFTAEGFWRAPLSGTWFREGFHGAMAELLCAVEERREPSNSGRENLRSLALAFAAIASAHTGQPQVPGAVRTLPVR